MENKYRCSKCRSALEPNSTFCSKCKSSFQNPVPIQEPTTDKVFWPPFRYRCKKCKSILDPESASCAKCNLVFDQRVPDDKLTNEYQVWPPKTVEEKAKETSETLFVMRVLWYIFVGIWGISVVINGLQGYPHLPILFFLVVLSTIWLSPCKTKKLRLVGSLLASIFTIGIGVYSITPAGKLAWAIHQKQQAADEAQQATDEAQQAAQQQSQSAADEAQQQQEAAQEQSQKAADAQKQADQKKQANEDENLTIIGDIGYLHMTGNQKGDKVIVASSADAWQDIAKEALANDNAGIQQMEEQGTAYEVPDGTQARLIDISGVLVPVMRIRIVGGDQDGQEGYIGDNFLKKNSVQ